MSLLPGPIDAAARGLRRRGARVAGRVAASVRSVRTPVEQSPRVAIVIAAPNPRVAPRFGDWYVAHDLAASLAAQGWLALVASRDRRRDRDVRGAEVSLVLRGNAGFERSGDGCQVLWIISHPDRVTAQECDEADLVLVASERFACHLDGRTTTPVEVMLQATDTTRFSPRQPVMAYRHDVAIVAKSRDVFRPIVRDAIAAGLQPAIYGSGWSQFVEAGLIDGSLLMGDFVPNDQLADVYASVGVLLGDHWEDMRRWGFVSNRVFDALACATPLVSDDLPELGELFGTAVATYREPSGLGAMVESMLADPQDARARARQGSVIVGASHTFDHRARQLVSLLEKHGLATKGPDPHESDRLR